MKAKITIVDQTKSIERQREDIATYQAMLKGLVAKLNEKGIKASIDEVGMDNFPIHVIKDSTQSPLIEIFPADLREESKLQQITFEVYKENVFALVNETAEKYKDKYHKLEEIRIKKYFQE